MKDPDDERWSIPIYIYIHVSSQSNQKVSIKAIFLGQFLMYFHKIATTARQF